jgi:hypothetical protein
MATPMLVPREFIEGTVSVIENMQVALDRLHAAFEAHGFIPDDPEPHLALAPDPDGVA